jgi:hypothetical protein
MVAAAGTSSTAVCSQPAAAATAAMQQLTRGIFSASSPSSSWTSQVQQPWRNELHRLTDGRLIRQELQLELQLCVALGSDQTRASSSWTAAQMGAGGCKYM